MSVCEHDYSNIIRARGMKFGSIVKVSFTPERTPNIRILKRNDRTRVRPRGTNPLKGTNPFLVKDSDSPFGLDFGYPVRIRTPRSDWDPDSPCGFDLGLPVPIRTPRSRVNDRYFGWEGERDRERMLLLQAEGVLSVRSPCFVSADKFLRGSRGEDAKTWLI
ncbi:hypothetical protein AVEN_66421-1 [Araneus ventricosus]|uniref:Uncharacterized protein n=1 Tax=Araneus ventricosus TaxID=182803 RepID=A0A4Y2EKE9_ARAVE|nr:hypothetical protein AVEN_66421-1 [Araneus ventricosus]